MRSFHDSYDDRARRSPATGTLARLRRRNSLPAGLLVASLMSPPIHAEDPWVVYEGGEGPGAGRRVVLVSGDEEYRSEEALPMLGKILAVHHGFRCTVLFAIDPDGTINPDNQNNIPGLEALDEADLMVLFTRFRELPDEQMKHIVDFVEAGKPIIGLRTATHAFFYRTNRNSPYAHYSFDSEVWPGGFGQQVLGDTWVNHHGAHGRESTLGVIAGEQWHRPVLRGVADVWGPTDVYGLAHLPDDAAVLLGGLVLAGMSPDSPPVQGPKNQTAVPIAWTRSYAEKSGRTARIFTTTMGASVDLENEGLRRLLVNAVYWGLGLEDQIPAKSNVDIVGTYEPTFFGFGKYRKGLRPSDFR